MRVLGGINLHSAVGAKTVRAAELKNQEKVASVEDVEKKPKVGEGKKEDNLDIAKDSEIKDEKIRTYTKPEAMSIEDLRAMDEQRMASFRKMLSNMLAKQGQDFNLSIKGINLNVSPADSAKAAASIAPGGEYSVEAVAGRIMDMAYALSGGDSSKLSVLKDAVQKGFEQAGMELGGSGKSSLPEISHKTYDEIMRRFDEWEKTGKPYRPDDVKVKFN